jgi:hypothetical protein
MKNISTLVMTAAFATALAGCATDSEPLSEAPEQQVAGLPSLGAVQDIDAAPVRRAITGSCGMESVEHFVGQPRLSISRDLLPPDYRVLGLQTQPVPDFRADRLTIRINEDDVVESMSCG